MQIKTFTAMTENGLDRKVNEYISKESIKVIEIQTHYFFLSMMATIVFETD